MCELNVSLFFPVYTDEATVRTVAEQGIELLRGYATQFEIIIIDDGSPDRSGQIADELSRQQIGCGRTRSGKFCASDSSSGMSRQALPSWILRAATANSSDISARDAR